MSAQKRKNQHSGFTLMEILAALMLIGLILPAVMKGVSLATMLASESARKYEALDLAETKLAEIILQEDWQGSTGSGSFEDEYDEYDQYEWMMEVSDWSVQGLKQVDVIVFWQQRNRLRDVTLSTLVYANQE